MYGPGDIFYNNFRFQVGDVIKPGGRTIDSYFSLLEQQRSFKELKIFAKKATVNKIEFSSNRKEGSITPGDPDYYKEGDTINGKIEFTSVWNGNADAFANGLLSTFSTKVKLKIQSRPSPIELNCSLSTDKNSLSFNYTVQNNDNDSDGITILTEKSSR